MNFGVILAGGKGKRMKANRPKPLCEVLGRPMLEWVIGACEAADVRDLCIVKGFCGEQIDEYLNGRYTTVLQAEQKGTGHAVQQAAAFLEKDTTGSTLVLCGDAPFLDAETIAQAKAAHDAQGNAVTVITASIQNPTGYGRILRTETGIAGIVEEKDANAEQKAICEINSGAYWFKTGALLKALQSLGCENAAGEYYLTDTVAILLEMGEKAGAFCTENTDVILGANSQRDLLELNTIARMRVIDKHLDNGVVFTCTDGITIEPDVEIGAGTQILAGTILRGKTTIGENCTIGPNCVIENCTVEDGVQLNYVQAYKSIIEANVKIGPFVHIRPNSHIKQGVKIGDFVEIKNSTIGEGTAVAHLTYVGDSDVGKKVNFGCGTVTVNYDGIVKSRCVIGDNCFIGCNTNLIAPVKLGKYVYTAAGTTVTKDVPDYSLAIDRGAMTVKEGYSLRKFSSKLEYKDKK
jgi:bifunctional UDP-N-acetylglucosamine pyrophosphorylase/glucosamine-1-phosphate N-acetyltransferase